MPAPKVLFVGQNWHGSNATSCKRSLRYLGCDVMDIDDWHFYPRWDSKSLKVLRRMLRHVIANEYSTYIEKQALAFRPDFVFVFKGVMLRNTTLKKLHSMNTKIFLFFPDVDPVMHHKKYGNDLFESFPYLDCVFTPKEYHLELFAAHGAKRVQYLPYAYDPWCHIPAELSESEQMEFGSDIAFIGTWGRERSQTLSQLVSQNFPYQLAVWGNGWDAVNKESPLRRWLKLMPATGLTQAKIFAGTKIALAFLSPPDQHTARTFEIPAYGAFMLAERTKAHLSFFEEGREFACFASAAELKDKIEYYVHHDAERQTVQKAGKYRVLQGNSYVDRMKDVLSVYNQLAFS